MPASVAEAEADLRFLIVEDESDHADHLSELLGTSFAGQSVVDLAGSVPEALTKLADAEYDLCFLDYCLEPYSGLDVLRTMAFRDSLTAFIFMITNDRRELAAEALHFGAMDYLLKSELSSFDLIKAVSFALYRKRREVELRRISLRDPLTGLGNRALFEEQFRSAILRAERNNERLGVALIDLDDFKPVNDTYGHQAGDEVLRTVARRLGAVVRKSDITARIGGDEFAALLLDVTDADKLEDVRTKIARAIAGTPFNLGGGREVRVGASVGIARFPDDSRETTELVRLADSRMYDDKKEMKRGR